MGAQDGRVDEDPRQIELTGQCKCDPAPHACIAPARKAHIRRVPIAELRGKVPPRTTSASNQSTASTKSRLSLAERSLSSGLPALFEQTDSPATQPQIRRGGQFPVRSVRSSSAPARLLIERRHFADHRGAVRIHDHGVVDRWQEPVGVEILRRSVHGDEVGGCAGVVETVSIRSGEALPARLGLARRLPAAVAASAFSRSCGPTRRWTPGRAPVPDRSRRN